MTGTQIRFLILCLVLFCKEWNNGIAQMGVGDNIFHCKWALINSTPTASAKQLYVQILEPSALELAHFSALPSTLTKSNPKLGEGIVKGVPKAATWANSTMNSWQLPPEHPRNNRTNCVGLAKASGRNPIEIYHEYKQRSNFYIVHARDAFIHETGITNLDCGYFQPLESCETVFKFIGKRWWSNCQNLLAKRTPKQTWSEMMVPPSVKTQLDKGFLCGEGGRNISRHNKVFVISAAWDNNYHHFLIDGLARLIRHIDFLLSNPDVKIHIRRGEMNIKKKMNLRIAAIQMRERILRFLGIDLNRLVSGQVIAREVMVPRGIRCNYPIAHALEIRLVALVPPGTASILFTQHWIDPLIGSLPGI